MKQAIKYIWFLPLLALVVAMASWDNGNSVDKIADGTINFADANSIDWAGVGDYATFDYRKDTITDAETNTLNIGKRDNSIWNTVTTPTNFLSLYTYDIKVRPVTLSGTLSQKVVLDASNMRSGTSTEWCAIDSLTGTTSNRTLQIMGTDGTASRYRLRVIGSGTQSSTYQIWTIWKKKN